MDSFQLKSQTGHSSQWSTCLTCWRSQNVSKSKELALQYFQWGSTESESCLDVQLVSVFVLRKILNYPEKECVKMMKKTCGKSPGDWFVLCEPCLKVAYQAWSLQVKICKLERQLKKVQNSAIAQLQQQNIQDGTPKQTQRHRPNKTRRKGTISVREVIRNHFSEQTCYGSSAQNSQRTTKTNQNLTVNSSLETCLICLSTQNALHFKEMATQYFQTWGSSSSDTKGVSESCLDPHLVSMFVLRKLLLYPETECAKTLNRMMGTSPGDWFVLCEPCLKSAHSVWRLHTQICKLENQLKKIQKSARAQLEDNNQGWDCGLTVDYRSIRESGLNVREEIRNFFKEQMYSDSLSLASGGSDVSKNSEVDDDYSVDDNDGPLSSPGAQGSSLEEEDHEKKDILSQKSKSSSRLKRSVVKKEISKEISASSSDDINDKSDTDYQPAPSPVKRKIGTGRPKKLPSLSSTEQKLVQRKKMRRPRTKSRHVTCRRKPKTPQKDPVTAITPNQSPKSIKPSIIIPEDLNRDGLSTGVLTHQPLEKPLHPPISIPTKKIVVNKVEAPKHLCPICKFPSSSQKGLEMHLTKFHQSDNSTQSVSELESTCANRDELVKLLLRSYHSVTMRKEKGAHDCPLCKETITGGKIRSHLLLHGAKYQEFECKLCLHPSRNQHLFHFHMGRQHKNELSPEQLEAYNIHRPKSEPILNGTVCYICGKNYSNKKALKVHLRGIHGVYNRVNCYECSASFDAPSSLRVHMKNEHGEGRVVCDICGKDYRKEDSLRIHLRDVHGIRRKQPRTLEPLPCPICENKSLRFQSRPHLEVHMMKKHFITIENATDNRSDADTVKLCTEDNVDKDVTDVNIADELITDKKIFSEDILQSEPTRDEDNLIDKKILVPDEDNLLERTKGSHARDKRQTKKRQKRPSPRINVNADKKKCVLDVDNDDESFVKLEKDEVKSQPCRKKNLCGQCGLSFMSGSRLRNHIRNYHSGGEKARFSQRVCEFCGAVCVNMRGLQFHRREAHKEFFIFKCDICNLGFARKGHLKTHLKTGARCMGKEKCVHCSVIMSKSKMAKHLESCAAAPVIQDHLEKAPETDTPVEVHTPDNLSVNDAGLTSVEVQEENGADKTELPLQEDFMRTPENVTDDNFDFEGIDMSDGGAFSDDDNNVEHKTKVSDKSNRFFECPHECPPPPEEVQIPIQLSHDEKLWDSHEESVNSIEDNIIVDDNPLPLAPPGPKRRGRPPKLIQPKENWQCKICFTTFPPSHKAAYLQHIKDHTVYRTTTCTICSYPCKSALSLGQHMTTHDNLNPTSSTKPKPGQRNTTYTCPNCDYSCQPQYSMERHRLICDHFDQLVTTTAKGTFRCKKCKKQFINKPKTISHVRKCDKKAGQPERQQCHMCHRNFPSLHALDGHIKDLHVATDCDICNQRYSSIRALSIHKSRAHSGKKMEPVVCDLCGLHFSLKAKLAIHVRKYHSDPDEASKGQRKCKYCDVICVNTRALRYHTKAAHPEMFKFKCELCDDIHITKRNLKYHVQIAHCDNKVNVKCSQCSMLIPSYNLKRHMKGNCIGKSD